MENQPKKNKLRDSLGRFLFDGGKKNELRDKPCLNCGSLIMRKSNLCRSCATSDRNSLRWKGGVSLYYSLHNWVKRRLGKANKCEFCKNKSLKRYEWANKSHQYKKDLNDWISLCPKCHDFYDKNYWGEAKKIYGNYRYK